MPKTVRPYVLRLGAGLALSAGLVWWAMGATGPVILAQGLGLAAIMLAGMVLASAQRRGVREPALVPIPVPARGQRRQSRR